MAKSVQLPDGSWFPLRDGEDPRDALSEASKLYPEAFGRTVKKPAAPPPESGLIAGAKSGVSRLKGDIAALSGRLGITDPAAAEQYIKEQEQYRQQTYKEPETWGEAPITKGLGLLGQSLPYMIAPIAAGYAAPAGLAALGAASVPAGLAALGAAGATSGAQFTGSFLTRQMEEGKKLEDTNLGYAAAAAVPAAALDLISLKMFPVVRNIFAAAGKEVSEKALLEATKQTTAKIAQDYALTTGITMGTEGLTEVGQQVLERLQAGLAIDDAKARSEYFDSFVGGAVLGGALAPAGRYVERSQEQGRQKAAQKAEQARLADEIRAVQAAEDAQRQEEAAVIQAREGAMEKARNMPGFTGVTDPNEAFLARSREQQEAAAQAAEQARQAQVAEVQNTVFHADPMENQRRKDAELAKLNALPAPQEPAPPIQVITPEQQEQEKVAAIQERMAETPAFTGGPGNANELMMQLSRLAKTEKSQQEKVDLQTQVDQIRNTEFSADPVQNSMIQQKEFEKLGFMPYVPIEMQLGMMPEGTPPAPLKPPPKADITPENQLQLAEQPAPAEVPAIPAIPAAPAAVPTATVPATAPAKPVEPMDERQKILSQRVDAVATMVRLREANKGNIPSPRSKAGQEYVEAQQRAKELTIRLMSKEAPEFQEATPTVGEPMPVSQEFEAETKDLLKQSKAATADINRAKRESYSLWQSLRGTLQPSEVNDISPDKEYKLLRAKAGTRGAVLDDIVADGKLDDFLPYDNRHDSPNFDLTDAVEHVKEKLRTKNYMTEDTNRALEILGRHKEEIEKQIELHLGLKDINYELQLAADEQRAIDQAAKAAPAQGEDAVAAPSEEQVAPEEELKLTQPTAEGIRAKEVETEKRAADEEKKAKEAEAKAKADKEVGEFTLTGSDRAADVAAAQGQTDIFAAPEPKKVEPKAEKPAKEEEDYFSAKSSLEQSDYFGGRNIMMMIDDEKTSIGKAAVKNRGLTPKYAAMAEVWVEATDAAHKAFGTNNFAEFKEFANLYPRTAKALKSAIDSRLAEKPAPAERKAEPKAEKGLPPELPIPADYKPIKGRHPQVVMAARELAAGRISKAQYDKYVDAYKPIAEVEKPEPPQTTEGMAKVLNKTQREKINPSIPAGTKVGLRMDIKALQRGEELGLNGSVVAIHPENNPKSPIGYASTGHLTNVRFAIRSEAAAMKIAKGEETKMPQQTAEGSWVPMAPGKVYADVLRLLKDPAWTQVSFDPLRHSYFYDRKNAKPVLSADEVYQVGRFLLAKNVKYGEREDFMYMKDRIEAEEKTETPEFKRWFGNSKVVDENGNPLIVYHGTASDIYEFQKEKLGINTREEEGELGFFFTSKPFLADDYSKIASRGGWSNKTKGGAPVVYPVYLSIKNPKRYETATSFYRDADKFKGRLNEWRNQLEKQGFDGVIVRSDFEEVIVFQPTQIKSAIGNIGTYDPTNPNILRMKDKIERDATPEQEQRADGHAQDFGGDIVYQRDGLALIRAFNAWNGKPVYIPVKDGLRAKVDIEAFTGSGISKADVKELTDAKKKWVAAEEEKAKNEPFVKYNNDGVAFSQSVPADFAGVIGEWKKMLGLKPNVYITTVDDARANRLNLIGDFASVAGSTLDPAAVGVMQRLPNGDYFIAYTKKISRVRMLETAAHELGHIHEMEVFNNQDAATKEAIKDEYYSWLEQQKTATARDLVNTLRARATAKGTPVADGKMAADLRAYWRSFSEWYADQVSKWATTQEKPLSVVEKFFAKLGAAMKAFYNKLRNGKYLPNQTFIKFMDRVTEAAVDSADRPFNKEPLASNQMEMQFMLGSIKEKAQQVLQKRTPMDESAFAGLDGDTIADLNKMFYTPNKTILDRMDSNKGKLFQWIAQKTVDEFRTAKEYSPIGHMQATLSKDTGGALENLLFHGHVTMNQGALDVIADGNRKGFIDSVKPLGKELDRWQIWMALSREANLPDSKRSSRLDDLVAKRDDFVKGDMDGRSRLEVYEQARKDVMALNKSVLNVALMNGLIDREAYQRFSNDMFYIPFYRAMEDGQLESVRTASRLSNQQFSKMLKGENEKPFGDLMENTLRNWSHILSASMKNLASNTILTDARDMGAVEPALKPGLAWVDGKVVNAKTGNIVGNGELVQMREDADGQEKLVAMTESKKGATDLVHTQVDGVTTYHHIIDPLLLESVGKITELGPRGLAVDIMRPFKDLLRFGVTASPTFKAYNLIRESIQSAALSDLSGNLVKNVYSGLYDSGKDSPIYRSALAGGGVFNFGSVLEGDRSEAVKKLISRGVDATTILDTPEKVKSMFTTMWRHYEDLGNKAENANRIALYKQLMEQGATHLEASFKARDLINFTAMGSSNAIRFVSATVPFFNARLQGLYKLGRDGVLPTSRVFYNTITGKELDQTDVQRAKSFTAVTGAVALASIALYMANKDDEDFQKREQWDRDAFWWAKIPGTDIAIRVPKPFETGAIATLVERTVEQMMDKDVETKRFTDALSRMVWQTFSMNPVPQFVKPLIDIYANKNPFTSAPIESAGMERLTKQERKTDSTSPIAIALGGVSNAMSQVTGGSTELSPIQIDYMIRAYMGWLGGTIAASTTQAIRPFNDGVYPSMDYTKTLALGFVEKLPTAQSTYMTDFYQNNVKIQQAYADMRHFAELQQSEKVLEILKEKRSEIAMSKFYDKTAKNLANIRQRIQMISNPAYKGMTSEQKEEEIKRLKQIMSMAAKQAEDARKQLKNQPAP